MGDGLVLPLMFRRTWAVRGSSSGRSSTVWVPISAENVTIEPHGRSMNHESSRPTWHVPID
jgi:hypothetical protein